MDKNSSSSSSSPSICRKIRQALSNNTALKAVQRITSFNQEQQEPKPVTKNPYSPSSNITNISIQSKPHSHHNKQGSGAVPTKFDHTAPKLSDHNGKKSSVTTSVAKGAPSEKATKVSSKGETHPHVSKQGKQNGQVLHYSHPQGNKKQTDINEHFKVFIENTREKMMRSVTNIGWGQSNQHHPEDAEDHHESHGSNKHESHFSEFIQNVRKKLRTTTTVRKSGSLREK